MTFYQHFHYTLYLQIQFSFSRQTYQYTRLFYM
nr:MAG TPA: hypothetical protein [Bacteriophage sp.]